MPRQDDGNFQINDVILNIPPTNISVSRNAFNYRYQTLRTRNSMKVKSGHSVINVSVEAKFVGSEDWRKLRTLMAELRVTPFCYINNEFLRQSILEGTHGDSLVLALKSINIRKNNDSSDCLDVTMNFMWFNYRPYTQLWLYRLDMFSPLGIHDPRSSNAWKVLVRAEIEKSGGGGRIGYLPLGAQLNDNVELGYYQFLTPQLDKKTKVNDFIRKVQKVANEYNQGEIDAHNDSATKNPSGPSEFPQAPPPLETQWELTQDEKDVFGMFGYTTSIKPTSDFFSEIADIDDNHNSFTYKGIEWEPLYLAHPRKKQEPLTYNGNPLFRRRNFFRSFQEDIIVTGVNIEFAHHLAVLPLLGHTYATCQHIASNDAVVSIQMVTTDNTKLGKLSKFYNDVEASAIKYRAVPPDQRRMKIRNDIVNMCGVHDCMIEQLHIETVPGQTELYAINMVLSDDRFLASTEGLQQEFVPTMKDINQKVGARLVKNIRWYDPEEQKQTFWQKAKQVAATVFAAPGQDPAALTAEEDGAFSATPKLLGDIRQINLMSAVVEYATFLTKVYTGLKGFVSLTHNLGAFGVVNVNSFRNFGGGNLTTFYMLSILTLTDDVLPGIEMVQRELMENVFLSKTNVSNAGGFDQVAKFNPKINGKNVFAGTYTSQQKFQENVVSKVDFQSYIANGTGDKSLGDLQKAMNVIYETPGWQENDELRQRYGELSENYETQVDSLRMAARNTFSQEFKDLVKKAADNKEKLNALKTKSQARDTTVIENVKNLYETLERKYGVVASKRLLETKGFSESFSNKLVTIFRNYRNIIDRLTQTLLYTNEFKDLRKGIFDNFALNPGNTAYPDFPSREIVKIIQKDEETSTSTASAAKVLFELWSRRGDAVRGIGPSAFINPDFYMLNEATDLSGNIFEGQDFKRITDITKKSLQNYQTERWNMINRLAADGGDRKRERQIQMIDEITASSSSLDKVWDVITQRDTTAKNALQIHNDKVSEMARQGEAPYDLAEGEYAQSAIKSLEAEGKSVNILGSRKWTGAGEVQSENAENKKISGSNAELHIDKLYVNEIEKSTLQSKALDRGTSKDNNRHENYSIVHQFGGQEILNDSPARIARKARRNIDFGDSPPERVWPVTAYRITSNYGLRNIESLGMKNSFHYGIDLNPMRGKALGWPFKAAASGRIIEAKLGDNNWAKAHRKWWAAVQKVKDAGKNNPSQIPALQAKADALLRAKNQLKATGSNIVIDHGTFGGHRYYTVYHHGQIEEHLLRWNWLLINQPNSPDLNVTAGQVIGKIGDTGYSTGPHLHFAVRKGSNTRASSVNPALWIAGVEEYTVPGFADGVGGKSLLKRNVDSYEASLLGGSMRGLNRAFPTFKLYFIESDSGERRTFGFDDFFSYAAVKDIQLIRHKDIPADLLILQLTNVAGTLSNRRFKNRLSRSGRVTAQTYAVGKREDPRKPRDRDTKDENPLLSILLQPGIQVQLRLGYQNNPTMLHHVINGEIAEVYFAETDDMVTVICQSYGSELIQAIKGAKSEVEIGPDTREVCEEMLAQPELKHFGRSEPAYGDNTLPQQTYSLLRDEWKLVRSPQDDNIFAPGNIGSFTLYRGGNKFVVWRTTIWDVFKEMTLRHPGYIAHPMPYEGYWGPRMTMFFGLPSQLYFSRDPQPRELESINELSRLQNQIETNPKYQKAYKNGIYGFLKNAQKDLSKEDLKNMKDISGVRKDQLKVRSNYINKFVKILESNTAPVKPFRSYHLLTSSNNIISNNIQAARDKTFNTVTIGYSDQSWLAGLFSPGGKGKAKVDSSGKLNSTNEDTFTMKYDDDLEDKDQVHVYAKYPNALGEAQVKRYALSLLWNSVKKTYQGTITVLGDANIKPYDICYIADDYTDMYGQIEVEQAVLKFSAETGFITEITPLCVIEINETATMTINEVMSLMAAQALGRIAGDNAAATFERGVGLLKKIDYSTDLVLDSIPGTKTVRNIFDVGGPLTKFLTVPMWALRSWISHSQYAHPFRFKPLVYRNEPMVRGLQHAHYPKGLIYNLLGKWIPEGVRGLEHKVGKIWADYQPENWYAPRGDFWSTFTGTST